MSDKDKALRLADHLELTAMDGKLLNSNRDAAAKLRSQHTRIQELEAELAEQCRINGAGAERELGLVNRVRELEGVARVALEALEWIGDRYVGDDDEAGECASCGERSYKPHADHCKKNNAIASLRKTLGEA